MSYQVAKVIVNRKPKLLHGELVVNKPDGSKEVVVLCDCKAKGVKCSASS